MIDKYNAFISYRHAKLDSKIAEHVQKSLERFHIPDKIRQSTGKKRIERIFRDKDELPITSDLTETISRALENSDYLIVICSENTKESFWVKREIEYFLRTHSKDHVLTVLAGGEPQDVIPQVLLTRERTFKDENGIEHTVEAPLEPLSCDYRLPMKKADREELPRLASAVIGCSYDELMNRRRAYRIRRAALLAGLLFSLMLAFGIYWLDTSRRIEQSLQAAMKSRSQYLANESIRLSKERDRLTAAQLALASVPENFPDMPLTPQSVRALNEATLAYHCDNGISIEPEWNYYMSGFVRDLCVSDDQQHLAAYDSLGNVRVWDTKFHELVLDVETTGDYIDEISFADDDTLIIVDHNSVAAYDIDDAEEIWRYDDVSMATGDVIHRYDGNRILMVSAMGKISLVDIRTGDTEQTWEIPIGELSISEMAYDPHCKALAIIFSDYEVLTSIEYTPGVYDLDTEQLVLGEVNEEPITDVRWLSNGNIVFGSYVDYSSVYYLRETVTCENTVTITSCSREDMSVVWENTITYQSSGSRLVFLEIGDSGNLSCDLGTQCTLLDIDTGETIRTIDVSDYIVCACDTGNGEFPTLVTRGGTLVMPFWLSDSFSTVSHDVLDDDLACAVVNGGLYTVQYDSDHITCFYSDNCDESLTHTADLGDRCEVTDCMSSDDITALIYRDSTWAECHLMLIDPSTNEILDNIDLEPDSYIGLKLAGIEDGKVYVYAYDYDQQQLIIVDSEDSSVEAVDIGRQGYGDPPLLEDGKICMYSRDGEDNFISVYDTASGDIEIVDMDIDGYMFINGYPHYLSGIDKIICTYEEETWLYDLKTGDGVSIDTPDGWIGVMSASCDPDTGNMIISDGISILCLDEDGDILEDRDISIGGRNVIDIDFVRVGDQDLFLIMFNDGCLYAYSPDIEVVATATVGARFVFNQFSAIPLDYCYREDGHQLFIMGENFVSVLAVDEWYETTFIDNCISYSESSDRFFVSYQVEDTVTAVGYFDRYSDEELIERAEDYLDGTELSDAQRAQYGI